MVFHQKNNGFFSRTRSDRVLVPYRNEPPNICLIWDTMTMHGFVQCRNTDHGDTFVTQRSRSQIFIRPLFHTTSPNLSSNSCHYFLITSFNNLLGFWGWNMNFVYCYNFLYKLWTHCLPGSYRCLIWEKCLCWHHLARLWCPVAISSYFLHTGFSILSFFITVES